MKTKRCLMIMILMFGMIAPIQARNSDQKCVRIAVNNLKNCLINSIVAGVTTTLLCIISTSVFNTFQCLA